MRTYTILDIINIVIAQANHINKKTEFYKSISCQFNDFAESNSVEIELINSVLKIKIDSTRKKVDCHEMIEILAECTDKFNELRK